MNDFSERVERATREANRHADSVVRDAWAGLGNPEYAMIDINSIRQRAYARRYAEIMGRTHPNAATGRGE